MTAKIVLMFFISIVLPTNLRKIMVDKAVSYKESEPKNSRVIGRESLPTAVSYKESEPKNSIFQ
ncbi:hypothetical protein [Bacteroides neonati]|uniref:hypothetical protein n=1 Tax=Bacteroides neonati TaxID=1347393 RepID=UPI001651FB12|nr:hypothetical protein [Bacteroides neonati]